VLVCAPTKADMITRPAAMQTHLLLTSARLERTSRVIAAGTLISGCCVLISWIVGLPGFRNIHPMLGSMSAHAALGFVLAATSLLLLGRPVTRLRRLIAGICAALVVVLAALTLGRWISASPAGLLPGRMPTATAEVFLAFGTALICIDLSVGRWRPAEFLSFAAATIALFAVVAYTFATVSIFGTVNHRPLAFHTLLLMMAFSFGLLAARPRTGLMSLVTSDTVAGVLVRRLLPAVIGIPIVAGWLALEAQRAGVIPPMLTLAYYATAIVLVFATMTWMIARSLHRIDMQRREAQEQVLKLNADLEQRVAHRTAQLERANSELEAFSYSISHDLRAPLRHIGGFAQMLTAREGDKLDETGRRYLTVISEGARNMGQMIDDLLRLARLERQHVVLQHTDLDAVMRRVIQELQDEIGSRSIEWLCEPLPTVECDPGLIKLVFANLLSNAVKYTGKRERAKISIRTQRGDAGMVFVVSDNGAGFDQRHSDKLFGVFHRLHRADEFEGIGIGLATVRRIVHKHGGRIWAEAEPDRGATFFFTLGADPS
jgi:signal transduction histidine kinase